MNPFFDNFYNFSGFGPATNSTNASQELISRFRGELPEQLLDYWNEFGFCGWAEGLFWTVNPEDYSEILDGWLKDTEFEGLDQLYVIGRSAFGKLVIWGTNSGQSLDILTCYGMIFPTDCTENLKKRGGDKAINLYFSATSKDEFELEDIEEAPLFKRALEALGPLDTDEMYGFVPALALGGEPRLENLQRVKTIEHLSFLAELGEKQVMADVVTMANAHR